MATKRRQRPPETHILAIDDSDALEDAAFLYNAALDAIRPVPKQPDPGQLQLPRGHATACSALRACIIALAEAAAAEQKKRTRRKLSIEQDDVGLAKSCSVRLRQLFCLSRCLYGRLIEWRAAPDALRFYEESQLEEAQKALAQASSYEAKNSSSCDEAAMLLMRTRLMNSSVWGVLHPNNETYQLRQQQADLQQLKQMGFCHVLTPQIFIPSITSRSRFRQSDRLRANCVSAFENSLQPSLLARVRAMFSADSPFFRENNYNSPGTGFFSFCHDLRAGATDGIGQVLHSVWLRACRAIPAAKRARFAEWWAHSRPHSNGHKLHFDFVQPSHANRPLHPIASTITFVSANCGGPTLITNQRVGGVTNHGWLVSPKENRLVVFDGSLLHCVLPGCGVHPSVDQRRITFMVALWEVDPCAPRFPEPTQASASGLTWPEELSRRIDGCMLEGAHDVSVELEAVKFISEVVVPVEGRRKRYGVDVMKEDVFTFFEALEPNVMTSANSVCSLNCGGTCEFCKENV